MYHHVFLYVIISGNTKIEECLKNLETLEDCEYSFKTVADAKEAAQLDGPDAAFVYDGVSVEAFSDLMTGYGKSILVAKEGSLLLQKPDVVSKVGAVWVMPGQEEYDEALLKAYFECFAEGMKQRADARKQRICFETLIDSVPDIAWFKDTVGAHLIVNQSFCDTVGKNKEQIYKKGHCFIWDATKEDEEVCLNSDQIIMESRTTQSFEENVKTGKGDRLLRSYKSALIDEDGKVFGTCGIAHDVTELHNMSTEMEIVLDSIPFAVLVEDKNGIVLNKNPHFDQYFPEFENIVGKSSDEWEKSLSRKIIVEDTLKDIVEVQSGEEQKFLVLKEEPIHNASRQIIGRLVTLMDITLERSVAEKNERKANTDYLTGLANRRCLMQYLEELHTREDFALIMIDLDNFKYVNDNFGHEAGDRALVMTADTMQNCFKDGFVSRLGGDEFMIVETGKELGEVKQDAEFLQECLRENFNRHKEFEVITVSIGIVAASSIPEEDRHVSNLMNTVDELLYKAKRTGKNRYCVYGED